MTKEDTNNLTNIVVGNICTNCGKHSRGLISHLETGLYDKTECPKVLTCCGANGKDDRFIKYPCPGLKYANK